MQTSEDFALEDPNEFVRLVRARKITLPYKRGYTSDDAIRAKYANLAIFTGPGARDEFIGRELHGTEYTIANANFKPHELEYNGEQILIVSKNTDYGDTGAISDMFQEHNRLRARFVGAKYSPNDFFYAYPEVVAADCIKTYVDRPGSTMTPANVREALYWQSSECSAFNPVILMYFINCFGARSVLDPCAGWGDRLIGAMVTGVRYVGIDPNADLHPGYEAIKHFFMPDKAERDKFTLINAPIQTATLPRRWCASQIDGFYTKENETFDLVFTSPPYFTMEEYTCDGRVTEESEDEWMWNFLWPMIDISIRRLNPGGHLVLALNQQPKMTYLRKLLAGMEKNPLVRYLGVISYTDTRITNPQPVWIWQKMMLTTGISPTPNANPTMTDSWESKTHSSSMETPLLPVLPVVVVVDSSVTGNSPSLANSETSI